MSYSGGSEVRQGASSAEHPPDDAHKSSVEASSGVHDDEVTDQIDGQCGVHQDSDAHGDGNGNGAFYYFDDYKKAICGQLKVKFSNCSWEDVKDAWQEACRKLHENLLKDRQYLTRDTPKAWLRTTAERVLQTRLRQVARDDRRRRAKADILMKAGSHWDDMNPVELRELQEIVFRVYEELNPFEQFVWDYYVEFYPKSRRASKLASVAGIDSLFETSNSRTASTVRGLLKKMVDRIREKFLVELDNGGCTGDTK